jgi:hypothetical protein
VRLVAFYAGEGGVLFLLDPRLLRLLEKRSCLKQAKSIGHQRRLDILIDFRQGLFNIAIRQFFIIVNVERRVRVDFH